MTPEAFARVLVQLHQLKSRTKLPANDNAFLRFPATQRAKHQLGNRHSREKDRIPISGSQLHSHMNIAPAQQFDLRCQCQADRSSQIGSVFHGRQAARREARLFTSQVRNCKGTQEDFRGLWIHVYGPGVRRQLDAGSHLPSGRLVQCREDFEITAC
jgi:hypothetical protein